jgi:hypothetical protein
MNNISLREFISATLADIALGLRDANTLLKNPDKNQFEPFMLRCNKGDHAKIPGISFDVTVAATDTSKEKAGFVISLVNIGGGASAEKGKESEASHRIQFEVGLDSNWK